MNFDPAFVDRHLDAVLRAAGSGLRYYSLPKSLDQMRAAMVTALRQAAESERAACAALCDSKVMAIDHGGNDYYRPAPADQCARSIRARGNSAEDSV